MQHNGLGIFPFPQHCYFWFASQPLVALTTAACLALWPLGSMAILCAMGGGEALGPGGPGVPNTHSGPVLGTGLGRRRSSLQIRTSVLTHTWGMMH